MGLSAGAVRKDGPLVTSDVAADAWAEGGRVGEAAERRDAAGDAEGERCGVPNARARRSAGLALCAALRALCGRGISSPGLRSVVQ